MKAHWLQQSHSLKPHDGKTLPLPLQVILAVSILHFFCVLQSIISNHFKFLQDIFKKTSYFVVLFCILFMGHYQVLFTFCDNMFH